MRTKQELQDLIEETGKDLRRSLDRYNNADTEQEQKLRYNLVVTYRNELQEYKRELAEL